MILRALLLLVVLLAAPAGAQDLNALIGKLADGDFEARSAAISELAATGDPSVAPVLEALGEGDLQIRESDGKVVIALRDGRSFNLIDPLTGEELGAATRRDLSRIRVNNRLRREIDSALGTLTLRSPDPTVRLAAADAILESQDPASLPAVAAAIEAETDAEIRDRLTFAVNAIQAVHAEDEPTRIAAIETIGASGGRESLSVLFDAQRDAPPAVAEATAIAIAAIERKLAMWDAGQNVLFGLSLGAVLLLAAIGLAITFGVMGVINMAHGEMVMIGAYTTFVVQEVIRTSAPWLFEFSLFVALPMAFLIAGAVGVLIERCVIRYLYGRPLETLLATWGLSLILQQTVRTIFGPSNREVGTPDWMSGSVAIGEMTLTMNRLVIIIFALVVFAALLLLLRRSTFGLHVRAVVQNRQMASAMGIRTNWVDAMTFGLGSGIAGIAGVALSQIDNVSPNLGQSYIIDSFMVVVFGGVGNLWGTLVGAMTLGVANKFLEPYTGAVLAKILVLVGIILFIQRRPRGLFALKGRSVET